MHERQPDGSYAPIAASIGLLGLRPSEIEPFLLMAAEQGQDAALRAFREWLRGHRRGASSTPSGS
jgi:hypothetical protein